MKIDNFIRNFKESFKTKSEDYRLTRTSKRKSFVIGFTTSLSLFSMALFSRALTAYAKELPIPKPPGTSVAPGPGPTAPTGPGTAVQNLPPALPPVNSVVNSGLSGMAGSICAIAVGSGSWVVGAICGVIVAIGILNLEKK